MGASASNKHATNNRYLHFASQTSFVTQASGNISPAATVTAIFMELETAPGTGGDAYIMTAQLNEIDTSATCTITDAELDCNLTDLGVDVPVENRVIIEIDPVNSPSGVTGATLGSLAARIP